MVANREIKFSGINKLASGLTVLWEREVPMENMHWEANKNPNFLMLELASHSLSGSSNGHGGSFTWSRQRHLGCIENCVF